MAHWYRRREKGVRYVNVLFAVVSLCIGCGGARNAAPREAWAPEASSVGIRQLWVSSNGDMVGTVVWDGWREGAVFAWDAARGEVRTLFRESGKRVTLGLIPGSTPAFAIWDAFLIPGNADAAVDPSSVEWAAYWYDGAEVRRDDWRTGRRCILRQALPARRSYLVTSLDAEPGIRIYEVNPAEGEAFAVFDAASLPHAVSGFTAMSVEEDANEAGPVLWLCSYAAPAASAAAAFAEGRPRAWIDAVSWLGGNATHLDSIELIHESQAWNVARVQGGRGVLIAASPSTADAEPVATPLLARWDADAGRIALEGGTPISPRLSRDAVGKGRLSAIAASQAWITPESLLYVLQYVDETPCSVFRAPLADYNEAQLLLGATARRAHCAAASAASDALVTWDGFSFDMYKRDGDGATGGLAKAGAWNLEIDANGALVVGPQ